MDERDASITTDVIRLHRLVREIAVAWHVIEKVVMRRSARDKAEVRIVWRGGATTELIVMMPVNSLAALPRYAEMERRGPHPAAAPPREPKRPAQTPPRQSIASVL